ncbi:MAG: carbamoyltransferase [Sphingobacteriales bacterium]|nr:carbamoyltransferase [Sphingobacteriales bacterium]
MKILGLNAYHGDASACLLIDGQVVSATEEERIRRIKHWAGFPSEAIKFCLEDAGLTLKDIDVITISRDPYANFGLKVISALKNRLSIGNIKDRVSNIRKAGNIEDEFRLHFPDQFSSMKAKFVNVEHHRSHLASAFFVSPFEESAVLSIDGFGDFSSVMTSYGKGNQLTVLDKVNYPHSLGVFYTAFTQYLGFPHYGDEYKVMGLAPYGKALYKEQVRQVIELTSDGLFKLNLNYFNHTRNGVNMTWTDGIPFVDTMYSNQFIKSFGPARGKEEELSQYHKDLAASVQAVTEEVIFHMAEHLRLKTKSENLCLAGGVGQNSVANGKIILNTGFKNLYIPPAAHDAGTSIGSALYYYHQTEKNKRTLVSKTGYYGYKASKEEIEETLKRNNVAFQYFEDREALIDIVTDRIIDGQVIGWYQGRAEFGPRALGHRSIIADPRRNDAKEILNLKIKRRESFRPFAPSILIEKVPDYFEQTDEVPFMEKVFIIKPEMRDKIPAVTHVDGTGRLQSVDKLNEPIYHRLIERFNEKTGVPILLNTSFNENEPIVNTPQEALDCYLRTKMDVLVMDNFYIARA